MAAATTTRTSFFTWPDEFRAERFPNFGIVRDLGPRRTAWTSNYSRSISVGSVSSPERQPKPVPERRKSKSVHFADSKGLALVSVLTFNAERELEDTFSRFVNTKCHIWRTTTKAGKCRPACEESLGPATLPTKLEKKVRCQKISLEKTELLDCAIRGTVYVENLAYEKCVTARYTLDGWKSHKDVQGVFHSNSNIKDIDTFVFEIPVQKESPKNYKMEFAICYTVLGDSFWDNNNGFNYHFLFASSHNPAL